MSEHLRAFVVVAILSALSFLVMRRPVVAMGMADEDFRRRRNLWLAVTALAFLSTNFWIFMLIAVAFCSNMYLRIEERRRRPIADALADLAVPPS